MRHVVVLLALAACLGNAAARTRALSQAPLPAVVPHAAGNETAAAAHFPSFAEAIAAANTTDSNLTTLMAAVEAAGVAGALNSTTNWTILAPTDAAFVRRLRKDLQITPTALLKPQNRPLLLKILAYHVIPSGPIPSAQLVDGANLTTALTGASPLHVQLRPGKKPRFVGATNKAKVVVPDVLVNNGSSVIHVVNDVLLPAGVGKKRQAAGGGAASGSDNDE